MLTGGSKLTPIPSLSIRQTRPCKEARTNSIARMSYDADCVGDRRECDLRFSNGWLGCRIRAGTQEYGAEYSEPHDGREYDSGACSRGNEIVS